MSFFFEPKTTKYTFLLFQRFLEPYLLTGFNFFLVFLKFATSKFTINTNTSIFINPFLLLIYFDNIISRVFIKLINLSNDLILLLQKLLNPIILFLPSSVNHHPYNN